MPIDDAKLPLVSVCIPAYNAQDFIAETIDSIINQTYQNIEIIVLDNHSTDKTWDILKLLSKKYSILRIEQNSENIGMTGNWNKVISLARGDYVLMLSADDMLKPTFLNEAVNILEKNSDVDMVSMDHVYLQGNLVRNRNVKIKEGRFKNFSELVLYKNPFSINFTVFRRASLAKLRMRDGNLFKRNFLTCDYDLWFRIADANYTLYYLSTALGIYRIHQNNLSRNYDKMLKQTFLTITGHKKNIKLICFMAYKITLLRLLVRYFLKCKYKKKNQKLKATLLKEFFCSL